MIILLGGKILNMRATSKVARRMASSAGVSLNEVVILSAARTPIGSFRGALASLSASQLGAAAARAAVQRAAVPADAIQEVYMGNVCSAQLGQAPARQVAIFAGLPHSTICTTVNKVCSSGMKAVMLAAQTLQTGAQEVALAGGMESMSNVPFYLRRGETPYGGAQLADGIVHDGLTDAYNACHMGVCAERTAAKLGFTRADQDAFALESYARSAAAYEARAFADELVPVEVPQRRGAPPLEVREDEEFRRVDRAKFATLPTVFQRDGGTVTAGNASTLNDGAAALVLATRAAAERLGARPLARVLGFADGECDPMDFPVAPAVAVPRLLARTAVAAADVALWEFNEAFSVVVLANQRLLGLEAARVNVHGGAVSLGHPIGMSGARLVVHLAHALRPGEKGVAAICNGGGGASSIMIERLSDEAGDGGTPEVTLYTRAGCTLCEVAREELRALAPGVRVRAVDIARRDNVRYLRLYRHDIPVLFLNGRYLCRHRLDAPLLRDRLAKLAR